MIRPQDWCGRRLAVATRHGKARALAVAARNFAALALAWAASSMTLHLLLTHSHERPDAPPASREKLLASRLAELCLVGAAVLLYRHWHAPDLSHMERPLAAAAGTSASVQLATMLLATAVLLKSAQLLMHGRLVQVIEARQDYAGRMAGVQEAHPRCPAHSRLSPAAGEPAARGDVTDRAAQPHVPPAVGRADLRLDARVARKSARCIRRAILLGRPP